MAITPGKKSIRSVGFHLAQEVLMACRLYRHDECRYHIDTASWAWAKYYMKTKRPLVIEDRSIGRVWSDRDGWVHRREGPALEWMDGAKEWWTDGYKKGYEDIGSGSQVRVGETGANDEETTS